MALETGFEQNLSTEDDQLKRLAEYWRVIAKRWWIVLSITTLTTIGAFIYFALLPNVYTAGAKILVEKSQNLPKIAPEVAFSAEGGVGDDETYYGTQIAILTGRKIAQTAQSELNNYSNYNAWAARLPKTQIIALSVTHRNPKMAADIANKMAEVYIRQSKEESLFLAQQVLQWLPQDAEILQDDEAMKRLPGFDKKEFAESLSKITEDPVLQKFKKEKLEIKDKLNEFSRRYKPKHPTMQALNERLSYADREIKERTKVILNNIRATLEGELRLTNVRVLEPAVPPGSPSGPNRPKGIQVGAAGGLAFSILLVFLLEYSSQKVREEKDLRPLINLPFLGYLPAVDEVEKDKESPEAAGASLVETWRKNPVLADAIANIRTHILFSMPVEKSKIIMFTSSIPDEGKTTVTTLLALSLAAMDKKVLLIDGDMRRPFLHTYLNLNNTKGLTDFLVGSAVLEEIIRPVSGTSLKVITGGSETPNPSELLTSDRFLSGLQKISQEFDKILIDVPPALYIPDGLILASHVHCSVLVCGSGMVDRKVVKIVREKFDAIGHGFLGIVINRADYQKEGGAYNKYFKTYHKHYVKQVDAKKSAISGSSKP